MLSRLVAVAAASAAASAAPAAEAPLGATAGVIAAAARAASGEAGQVRLARDWRFEARRPEAGKSWYGATSVGSGVVGGGRGRLSPRAFARRWRPEVSASARVVERSRSGCPPV